MSSNSAISTSEVDPTFPQSSATPAPIPSIHLIDSFSGGKGKSTFARFIAHHIDFHLLAAKVIDADVGHNIKPYYPDTLEIDIRANKDYTSDEVTRYLRGGLSLFINFPGSSFEFSSHWLQDHNLTALQLLPSDSPDHCFDLVTQPRFGALNVVQLQQGEAKAQDQAQRRGQSSPPSASPRIVRWFLSGCTEDDAAEFRRTVEYYDHNHPGHLTHVLVRNNALLPNALRPNWDPLYSVSGFREFLQRPDLYDIEFPRLEHREMNLLQREKLKYVAGVMHPDWELISRSRIDRFLVAATQQIEQCGLLAEIPSLEAVLHPEQVAPNPTEPNGASPPKAKTPRRRSTKTQKS
ncbi:hypothetical protein [Leptolyngbya sp. PCC 6406]|uniref:hypothetical protein n=1 Tax=Leptolyngbya sp. PCC 6406 TaxID=1173264 RepID=UPI0002ABA75B|nr:hypothetical protein [Leptolyngbya sp. PCC 6406]